MFSFLKRWRPATLFASWVVYWILLGAVALGPALSAIWKATHSPPDTSNVAMNFSDGMFQLLVTTGGRTTYSGSAHLLAIALLVGGPPLILWALWVSQRQRAPEDRMSA